MFELKFIICFLCFLLIICCLVIAKQNSTIKEQNSLLEETAPIIDHVYNNRNELHFIEKKYRIIEVRSKFIDEIGDGHIQYSTEYVDFVLCKNLIEEIKNNCAIEVKKTDLNGGDIEYEARLLIAVNGGDDE